MEEKHLCLCITRLDTKSQEVYFYTLRARRICTETHKFHATTLDIGVATCIKKRQRQRDTQLAVTLIDQENNQILYNIYVKLAGLVIDEILYRSQDSAIYKFWHMTMIVFFSFLNTSLSQLCAHIRISCEDLLTQMQLYRPRETRKKLPFPFQNFRNTCLGSASLFPTPLILKYTLLTHFLQARIFWILKQSNSG